jgi:hypothetical protein
LVAGGGVVAFCGSVPAEALLEALLEAALEEVLEVVPKAPVDAGVAL